MVNPPGTNGQGDDGIEVYSPAENAESLPPSPSTDELLTGLQRDVIPSMSAELLDELKAERSERKRLELLESVLEDSTLSGARERYRGLIEVNEDSPEFCDAIEHMSVDLLYVLPKLKALDPNIDLNNLEQLALHAEQVEDPFDQFVLRSLSRFSRKNSDASELFFSGLYRQIALNAEQISPYVDDVIDRVENNSDESDENANPVTSFMKNNPKMTSFMMMGGAVAGIWAIRSLWNKVSDQETINSGVGFVGRIGGISKMLMGTTAFGLSTFLPVAIAGSVLNMEPVRRYLESQGSGEIYDNRFVAFVLYLLQGEVNKSYNVLRYGAPSLAEREKNERYANHFGLDADDLWLMGRSNFKDFISSDVNRTHPLSADFLSRLPWLGEYFNDEGLLGSEKTLQILLTSTEISEDDPRTPIEVIRGKIPNADTLTLSEVLSLAFFQHKIFNIENASDAAEVLGDGLGDLQDELESDASQVNERLSAHIDTDELSVSSKAEILSLTGGVLDEISTLNASLPTTWTEYQELISRTLGLDFIYNDGEVEGSDMVRARENYEKIFQVGLENDQRLMGEDIKALDEARLYIDGLPTDRPLTTEQQDKLNEYLEQIKEINNRILQAIVQSKIDKKRELLEDQANGFNEDDIIDVMNIWVQGYGTAGVTFALSMRNVFDPDLNESTRVANLTAAAGTGFVLYQGGRGLAMTLNGQLPIGQRALGALNMFIPGVKIPFENVRSILGRYYTPQNLLSNVLSGKISMDSARSWAQSSSSYFDDLSKSGLSNILYKSDRVARKEFLTLIDDLLKNVTPEALDDLVKNGISNMDDLVKDHPSLRGAQDTLDKLDNHIRRTCKGQSLTQFLRDIRRSRGPSASIIRSGTPFLNKTVDTVRNLGRETLNKAFSSVESVKQWSDRIALRMGFQPLSMTRIRAHYPNLIKLSDKLEGAGVTKGNVALNILLVHASCLYAEYDADKAQIFLEKMANIIAGTITFRGVAQVGHGVLRARQAYGAAVTATRGARVSAAARAGVNVGVKVPGHPVMKVLGGILAMGAAVGVGFTVEEALDPILKKPTFGANALKSVAPFLHIMSGGPAFDRLFHHYQNDEREHFMTETYLMDWETLIGGGAYKAKMAFGYDRNEQLTEQEAVWLWNDDMRIKAAEAREKGKESKALEFEAKMIDDDWVQRRMVDYYGKKQNIELLGSQIYDTIVTEYGAEAIPVRELAYIESILITDAADSWFIMEHTILEDDLRYATVLKYLNLIDEAQGTDYSDYLDSFSSLKSDIQKDKEFYGLIGYSNDIVRAKEEDIERAQQEQMLAFFGLNDDLLADVDGLLSPDFGVNPGSTIEDDPDHRVAA